MMRKSGNVREQILDAAIALLRESGVKRLAQPQVARAAGVPQGHLTYYFPRKFDLLAAVARRFTEMIAEDLQAFFASDGWTDVEASAPARATAFVSHFVKDRERTRMLLGLVVEAESDPALRDVLAESTAFLHGVLAGVLGRTADDPDVDIALATLWGLGLQHLLFAERRDEAETNALIARVPQWFAAVPAAPVATPALADLRAAGSGHERK